MAATLAVTPLADADGQSGPSSSSSPSTAPSNPPNPALPFRQLTTGPFALPTVNPGPPFRPTPGTSTSPSPAPVPPKSYYPAPAPAVVYVLAAGGDSTTRQKFIATLTEQLQSIQTDYIVNQPWNPEARLPLNLIPEPDWAISDYTNACQSSYEALNSASDPSDPPSSNDEGAGSSLTLARTANDPVAGALIVGINSIAGWVDGRYYIWTTNNTRIWANLYYSVCDTKVKPKASPEPNPTPAPKKSAKPPQATAQRVSTTVGLVNGKPTAILHTSTDYTFSTSKSSPSPPPYSIGWYSQLWESTGTQPFFTPLSAVAVIMAGVSAWAAFTPQVTKSTMTTTQFPTPSPGSTVPPYGFVTTSATNNSKVTNPNNFGTLANTFIGGQNINIATNLSLSATNDQTTASAVSNIVTKFVNGALECPGGRRDTFADPSSLCFAIIAKRNDGSYPDVDSNYDVTVAASRVFNDCAFTYLQVPNVNDKALQFFKADGSKVELYHTAPSEHGRFVVIYGLPAVIKYADDSNKIEPFVVAQYRSGSDPATVCQKKEKAAFGTSSR